MRLRELAASRVRYGYRRLTVLLKREGWAVNAKRIYRLYSEEGLIVRTTQAQETSTAATHTAGISHTTQPEVEHGFCCPAAGGRPLDSGADSSRPVHARVLGVVRGCFLERGESRSGVGQDCCRARCAAVDHRGQRDVSLPARRWICGRTRTQCTSGLHPARTAGREWLHRELQRQAARRVPERGGLLQLWPMLATSWLCGARTTTTIVRTRRWRIERRLSLQRRRAVEMTRTASAWKTLRVSHIPTARLRREIS